VKRLLYLIGAPGSGKTSVLRGALAPAASVEVVNLPPRMTFYDGGALSAQLVSSHSVFPWASPTKEAPAA
jgi:predicted ATPase